MEEPSTLSLIAKYSIDIFLAAVFFYILFFCKPDPKNAQENNPDEEEPNELEKRLMSDSEDEDDDNADIDDGLQ